MNNYTFRMADGSEKNIKSTNNLKDVVEKVIYGTWFQSIDKVMVNPLLVCWIREDRGLR